ncbi:MAG: hypothetical protein RH942_04340 [Kiloniellaceae bacterium]
MIEEPPVLTIRRTLRRPAAAQVAAFQGVATGLVVDAMFGGGALDGAIRPLAAGPGGAGVTAGPALTADCGPADILATLAALNFIAPGDVVVAAFAGHQGCAAVGDRVCGMLRNAGAAGFVTDGPARDSAGIAAAGLPVWCSGLTPASPFSKGPGSVGFPIQIGGQEVETGDMVVADRDGVVIVPHEKIDAVIESLAKVRALEAELDAEVAAGLKVPAAIAELLAGDQVKYSD